MSIFVTSVKSDFGRALHLYLILKSQLASSEKDGDNSHVFNQTLTFFFRYTLIRSLLN